MKTIFYSACGLIMLSGTALAQSAPNPFPDVDASQTQNSPIMSNGGMMTAQPVNQSQTSSSAHIPEDFTPVNNVPSSGVSSQSASRNTSLSFPGVSSRSSSVSPPRTQAASPQDPVFQQALKQIEPATPDMIRQFRSLSQDNDIAQTETIQAPLSVGSRTLGMTLAPGENTPSIHLAKGIATVLTFSDVAGNQWPILSVTVGDSSLYDMSRVDYGKSNMVVLSPRTMAGSSNLIVTLLGHPVPVIVMLKTGRGNTDARVDVSIKDRGPNYHVDMAEGSTLAETDDAIVQDFVNGLPPKGARSLTTDNENVEAWKYHGLLYVRTPLTLTSPAYISYRRNVSGQKIYKLMDTSVIMAESGGRNTDIVINH